MLPSPQMQTDPSAEYSLLLSKVYVVLKFLVSENLFAKLVP